MAACVTPPRRRRPPFTPLRVPLPASPRERGSPSSPVSPCLLQPLSWSSSLASAVLAFVGHGRCVFAPVGNVARASLLLREPRPSARDPSMLPSGVRKHLPAWGRALYTNLIRPQDGERLSSPNGCASSGRLSKGLRGRGRSKYGEDHVVRASAATSDEGARSRLADMTVFERFVKAHEYTDGLHQL